MAVQQQRVGGDAVAFVQYQQVADHHLAAGHAGFLAAADHQRARRRQLAQRFQRALGLALLRQRDADHHEHERQQERRLGAVAQCQVQAAGDQQHQEHRLGEHPADDRQHAARRVARQQVGAVGGQPARRLGRVEAAVGGRRGLRVHVAWPLAVAQRQTSTGTSPLRITLCVSLPSSRRSKPRQPCEAITIRSHSCLRATSTMAA